MKYFFILSLFLNTGFIYSQNNDFGIESKYYNALNFDHNALPSGIENVIFNIEDSLEAKEKLLELKFLGWHDVVFYSTKSSQIVVYPEGATMYFCEGDECFNSKEFDQRNLVDTTKAIKQFGVDWYKEYYCYTYFYSKYQHGYSVAKYGIISEIRIWMEDNHLDENNSKTQILSIGNFLGEYNLWRAHWVAYVKME